MITREEGGEPVTTRHDSAGRTDARMDTIVTLNDMEPIPPKDLPSEIRDALESANIKGDAYYKTKPCHVCGGPGHPTSECNRLYVLTPEGRRKYQASYERVRSMGVKIDGKRIANFAHLSDVDNLARAEVEQALPAGQILGD
eukprot:582008-Pleurochrysis_carterae.AAC.1